MLTKAQAGSSAKDVYEQQKLYYFTFCFDEKQRPLTLK